MELVGLNPEHFNRFPLEFSGGQRQRIGVARALATEPSRPRLRRTCLGPRRLGPGPDDQPVQRPPAAAGLTYLFIAHDLAVVEHVSDRIAVMYLGKIVEVGPTDEVTQRPRHPYTHALLSALPVLTLILRRSASASSSWRTAIAGRASSGLPLRLPVPDRRRALRGRGTAARDGIRRRCCPPGCLPLPP